MPKELEIKQVKSIGYHFEADFSDGTTYTQGSYDQSIDTPGKNAFFDILARENDVIRFHVVREADDVRWTVDLQDGHFEVNGVPFDAHEQFFEYPGRDKIRLAYWKEVRHEFNAEMVEQRSYVNRYFLGWRTEEENKKGTQCVIAVK